MGFAVLNRPDMTDADVSALMNAMGESARVASAQLATADAERKHAALVAMADEIMVSSNEILAANAIDMEVARENGISSAFLDRLNLTKDRVRAMADGIRAIADLKDPVGDVIAAWGRPNGL